MASQLSSVLFGPCLRAPSSFHLPDVAGPRAGHSEAIRGARMLPVASARAKAVAKRAEQNRELGDRHAEGGSTLGAATWMDSNTLGRK